MRASLFECKNQARTDNGRAYFMTKIFRAWDKRIQAVYAM